MDLSTTYLGVPLPHPLVVGAGPLGDDLDTVRALEDAGAAMIVLRSLYEEEITSEQMNAFVDVESYSDSFPEAGTFAPDPMYALGPDEYLEHLRLVKQAVKIPVIGMGGISTAVDIAEFMLAGATAVQIGTANYWDPCATEKIVDELRGWCVEHRVERLASLTGGLVLE